MSKYCCRIFPVILLILSSIITAAIWYLDEGNYSFSFLTDKNELIIFFGWIMVVFAFPVGIFYLATEKEKFKGRARQLALLGFFPELVLLVLLLSNVF
jgi:NADH:ubiquinone oxidoreductase subunit 6 (subunit J)